MGQVPPSGMRYAKNRNGSRLFDVSEYLTAQQIKYRCSRVTSKLRQTQAVTDEDDFAAAEDEFAFTTTRNVILHYI